LLAGCVAGCGAASAGAMTMPTIRPNIINGNFIFYSLVLIQAEVTVVLVVLL
jgi:hypothetical protein